ncbi:4'-phosphopantetheinyl transferase family protein [Enterococcus sp. CWB-B31]|uniref:4'-phosphopantetheinyl transferase family protein n=1 Tax=Enterococcus sp. CWB-B31 TaxID=2885159 RepID=UPI001E2EDFF0|nr:4'-phosphopantetheinyl transferase superfamily protein [Enterococcus sp. CWB-B31]MCB5953736.1 4'-phosphopantetheinyl transferase superfamily protein [Enterococcus sp. CWB-B31]
MIIQGEITCFEKRQDKIEIFEGIWHRYAYTFKEELEEHSRNYEEFLSEEELSILKKKERCNKGQEYVYSRTFAKEFFRQMIDSEHLFLDMKDVEIRNDTDGPTKGKPRIHVNNRSIKGSTSLSHSDSSILISHGKNCWMGVDVQEVITSEAIVENESIFSFEERRIIDSGECFPKNKAWTATLIWSIKEAVGKALGVGLSLGLKSISVMDIRNGQIWINLIPEVENVLLSPDNRLIIYYKQHENTFFVICCMFEKVKLEA